MREKSCEEISAAPVRIKKYTNRRLYNVETSSHVNLHDLASMTKAGQDFVVLDARTGDDITHSVLTQVIFDQESRGGHNLLPLSFLRQLIRMYDASLRDIVPDYLDMCLNSLVEQQERFSHRLVSWSDMSIEMMQEQAKRNLQVFGQAISSLGGVAGASGSESQGQQAQEAGKAVSGDNLEELKRQIEELRSRVDVLSKGR